MQPIDELMETFIAMQWIVAQIENLQFVHRLEVCVTSVFDVVGWNVQKL